MSLRIEDLSPADQKAIRELKALLEERSKDRPKQPTIAEIIAAGGNRCGTCRYMQSSAWGQKCSSLKSPNYMQARQHMSEGCDRHEKLPTLSERRAGA